MKRVAKTGCVAKTSAGLVEVANILVVLPSHPISSIATFTMSRVIHNQSKAFAGSRLTAGSHHFHPSLIQRLLIPRCIIQEVSQTVIRAIYRVCGQLAQVYYADSRLTVYLDKHGTPAAASGGRKHHRTDEPVLKALRHGCWYLVFHFTLLNRETDVNLTQCVHLSSFLRLFVLKSH